MKTLKYAIRMMMRMKAYSIICILGLVISMAGTLTLVRYIHQELTVDHYAKDLDKLHLLCQDVLTENITTIGNNRNWNKESQFVDPLSHPSVESYTTITLLPKGEIKKGNHHFAVRGIAVDTLFFQYFPPETSIGTTDNLPPTGILLTEEFSRRIYGKDNPMGQSLTFGGKEVTVYGILKTPATKASLNYDIVVSKELQREWMGHGNAVLFCIARLHHADNLKALNEWQPIQKLITFNNRETRYRLSPYKDFYLNSDLMPYNSEEMCPKGNRNSIRILIFVAILLFLIGILNYLNLYTVIMQKRGLEFGVKKVFGADRWTFFKHLYTENLLLSAITLFFVGMVIEITDKILANTLEIPIYHNISFDISIGLGTLWGLPLLTMLYPYFRHVYGRPVASLKGLQGKNGSSFTRSLFLSVQYIISFCLIIVSIYFAKQLNDMLNADLGFRTKDIIRCTLIPAKNEDALIRDLKEWERKLEKEKQNAAFVIQTLNSTPSILSWSVGDDLWNGNSNPSPLFKKANTDDEFISGVCEGFSKTDIKLFDLKIIEGRGWNESDQFASYNLIINESAKKALGITDINTELIQTKGRIWWAVGEDENQNPPFHIVGVVNDIQTGHLSKSIIPTIYTCNPLSTGYIHHGTPFLIRYQPGKQQEVLKVLANLRNEVAGEGEFEYSFLKDEIAKRYENDRRIVSIYLIFAGLAIAVSCLGLLGLSLFEIRLRYREIALRKVHGAKTNDIVRLLSKRYLYLLGISALIAFPIAILFIEKYMEDYAYRTPLSWWIFFLAIVIVATISASVLLWQIRKASNINPAKIMKTE